MARELTEKQRTFVTEYLVDLNATAAYRRAGYSARGNAAEVNASRLLRNAQVQVAVTQAMHDRSERTGIDAAWLLTILAAEATADIADLYTDDGQLKPVKDWPMVWRQGLVAGIEVEELFEGRGADRVKVGFLRKVKLADRTKIKELIGKHVNVGAFGPSDGANVNVNVNIANVTTKSPQEAAQVYQDRMLGRG